MAHISDAYDEDSHQPLEGGTVVQGCPCRHGLWQSMGWWGVLVVYVEAVLGRELATLMQWDGLQDAYHDA